MRMVDLRTEWWSRLVKGLLVVAVLAGCGVKPENTVKKPFGADDDGPPQGGITGFYTKNVIYRVDEDIVVGMPDLVADVQVKRANQPFIPSNINDYLIHIHTGNLVLDDASMTAIMNKYAFNYPGSPLSDLNIANKDGKVAMSGTLHKGIPIPFYMEGSMTPNNQGQLVLKPDVVKSAGIPVKGIMEVLGLEMARLINSQSQGVQIDGNNVVITPCKLLPPPACDGFVGGVKVEPGKITMMFDDQVRHPYPNVPEPEARNYILMWGGNVLINNHLILDAKLMMIDDTPQDPMFFYIPAYRDQLAGGYVVADHGFTIAYIPDVHGTTVSKGRFRPRL